MAHAAERLFGRIGFGLEPTDPFRRGRESKGERFCGFWAVSSYCFCYRAGKIVVFYAASSSGRRPRICSPPFASPELRRELKAAVFDLNPTIVYV